MTEPKKDRKVDAVEDLSNSPVTGERLYRLKVVNPTWFQVIGPHPVTGLDFVRAAVGSKAQAEAQMEKFNAELQGVGQT